MNVKLNAEVTSIELKESYAKKKNGLTDYDAPKIKSFESTLRIVDNPSNLRGTLIVPEQLKFGAYYEFSFNSESGSQVIELEPVSDLQVYEEEQ